MRATDHVSYGKQSKLKDVNKPPINLSSVRFLTEFQIVATTTVAAAAVAASIA